MTVAASIRRRLETGVVAAAILTALPGAMLADSAGPVYAATAYLAGTLLALFNPTALFIQVIAGQVLVGSLLFGSDPPGTLIPVLMIVAVVGTAELVAMVGRRRVVSGRGQGGELRLATTTAVTGGVVFGAVLLVGALPGPTGLAAVVITSVACGIAAFLLVREPA